MFKQTFSTLFLCLCFGAFSCTDKSGGFFAGTDDLPPSNANGGTGGVTGSNGSGVRNPNLLTDADLADNLQPHGGPNDPPEPVPEPMTMLLFGSGLAGVAYRYRRRKAEGEGEASKT